ncbi:hypothetical protein LTR78_010028 [Recurvomyces mirabilis]|uniref:Uncharacterized protein n=1 Tax=Recurvomyces mirabilis TaxID=574656 RepID=A0AAE0WID2_9PEZI|nr:hypothetical protein LTR78_010028 [Recurvomyces mirabilis]KAK5149809.1 hypothetical protein LTS14_010630 [Recurvomyces mirabilis]
MEQYIKIADYAAGLLGAMMFGIGLQAQLQPMEGRVITSTRQLSKTLSGTEAQTGAKQFAGKIVTNQDRAIMFPIVGGRNMWIGAAMLALTLQGQRKAVGTILATGMIGGGVDAWWCYRNGSEKWLPHIIGSSIGIPLSYVLLHCDFMESNTNGETQALPNPDKFLDRVVEIDGHHYERQRSITDYRRDPGEARILYLCRRSSISASSSDDSEQQTFIMKVKVQ